HHDRKGLTEWLSKHNRYTTQEAIYALTELQQTPYSALLSSDPLLRRRALKRLFRALPCNSSVRFWYLYVWRLGFLDGKHGLNFCKLRAQQQFVINLKIQELQLAQSVRP